MKAVTTPQLKSPRRRRAARRAGYTEFVGTGARAGFVTVLLAALGVALAVGCQKTIVNDPRAGPTKVTVRNAAQVDPGTEATVGTPGAPTPAGGQLVVPQPTPGGGALSGHPDDLAGDDACLVRVDNIREHLLIFWVKHRRLPATLEELRGDADPGDVVDLSCPASNQPYVYVPAGLRGPPASGKAADKRLILYDPTAAHRDPHDPDRGPVRRGILMTDPTGNRPMILDGVSLTDKEFRAYADNPLNPKPPAPAGPAAP